MTTLERYRKELRVALRLYDIAGTRVGEVLAEVEAHVADTGEDPVDAFGTPREYAARVASQLDPSTGKPSTLQGIAGVLVIAGPAFLGLHFLINIRPDGGGAVVVTLADMVGWVLFIALVVVGVHVAFRAAAATSNRVVLALVYVPFYLAAVVSLTENAPALVIGDEPTLFELSRRGSVAVGVVLLAVAAVALRPAIRRGRVVDPRIGRVLGPRIGRVLGPRDFMGPRGR